MYGLQLSGLGAVNFTTGYDSLISNASIKYGVDTNLIKAVIQKESSWNPRAYNLDKYKDGTIRVDKYGRPSESLGLMQILIGTAEWMLYNSKVGSVSLDSLYDPSLNIEVGVKYLAKKLSTYNGNIPKAIAAYNAGKTYYTFNGNFVNQSYVDKVMDYYQEYVNSSQLMYADYELPTPYIAMDTSSADTTIADVATVDVLYNSDVEELIYDTAQVDNPSDISLPFDPIIAGIVLGGVLVITGGGFAIFKNRR